MNESAKVVGRRDRNAPRFTEPSVIAKLEQALAEARRGEIIAFAMAAITPRLEIHTFADGNRHVLVAACNYLLHDLIAADKP